MSQVELERSILDARDRGDQGTLQRLQERYRSEFSTTRISGSDAIVMLERDNKERTTAQGTTTVPKDRSSAATLPAGMNAMPPGVSGCTINNKAGYEGGASCHTHDGDEASMKFAMTAAMKDAGRRSSVLPETVWLSRDVLDELNDLPLRTGIETGAWLFGRRIPGAVEVQAIDGWTEGDEERVVMHRDIQLERGYASEGLKLLGDMHTHPYWSDRSDGDEEGWQELARVLGRSVFGMIVTGKYRVAGEYFSFDEPRFQAWIASGTGIRQVSVTKESAEPWPPRLRPLLPLIDEER